MEESYESIIRKISEKYGRIGYSTLWSKLDCFLNGLGVKKREIIIEVVDRGFLLKRTTNVNTRFILLSEREMFDLSRKCGELENERKK